MPSQIKLTLEKVAELRAMLGDADPDLIRDMIEGETEAFELMDWLLAKEAEEFMFQEAIENRIETLRARQEASGNRRERLRGAIEALMTAIGDKTIRRPDATVTLGWRKPGISSIDESQLPDQFWKIEKKVSRSAINEAFGKGEIVPGVMMDNGGNTLTIRRK